MTTQHTPGPWRLAWGKIVDQSDKAVCLLAPRKGALNSHLIASAPELLDVVKRIYAIWDDPDRSPSELADSVDRDWIRAAIAKAEGRAK